MAFPLFRKKINPSSEALVKEDKIKKAKKTEVTHPPVEKKKPVSLQPAGSRDAKFKEAYRVLEMPHVTEKATDLAGKNQYVFRIFPRANKSDVKKAIGKIFKVDVLRVRIINIPKKKRKFGKIKGFKEGYKKAIVRIREGQKIEVLPR